MSKETNINNDIEEIKNILYVSPIKLYKDNDDKPLYTSTPIPTSSNDTHIIDDDFKTKDLFKPPKIKCSYCNKKLKFIERYDCSCNLIFCSEHRLRYVHNCTTYSIDNEKQKLEKSLPKIIGEKLNKV